MNPNLSTRVALAPSTTKLGLGERVYAIGSCFAEHLAARLQRYLFPRVLNPYGIAYNPLSLARMVDPTSYEPELFLHDARWRSLQHHSSLAWTSREQTLQLLANAERVKHHALEESRWLILTLGTAQAFTLASSKEVVANCQRLPNSLFQRRLLNLEECLLALQPHLHGWLDADPSRQVVLTVSPVRYLRDGLVENARGKAVLLLLCQALEASHPRINYFPAYEIVIDELRSYRFFENDMVHPSALAVDIVWQRFLETYLKEDEQPILTELEKLWRSLEHVITPSSDLAALGRKGMERLQRIQRTAPQLDTVQWEERFQAMLDGSTGALIEG